MRAALLSLALLAAGCGGGSSGGGESPKTRDAEYAQWLAEPGTHDAESWLMDDNHVLFEGSKEEMLALIDRFNAAGAIHVWIVGAEKLDEESPVEIAAAILIEIPPSGRERERCLEIHGERSDQMGYDREKDQGQKYLHVSYD